MKTWSTFVNSHRFPTTRRVTRPGRRYRRLRCVEQLEKRLLLAGDLFEPNDTWTSATDLGEGNQRLSELTIHTPQDEDWFVWTAPSDGTLGVDLLTSFTDVNLSVVLDSDPVAPGILGRFAPPTDNEKITASVRAGQKYWINVSGGSTITSLVSPRILQIPHR